MYVCQFYSVGDRDIRVVTHDSACSLETPGDQLNAASLDNPCSDRTPYPVAASWKRS